MKKILFIIPSFSGGGAERVLAGVLRLIDKNKFKPLVVTFSPKNDYQDQLPSNFETICLNKKNKLDFFRLIFRVSRIIKKENPDLVVSFLSYTNYLTLFASKLSGRKIPVIISERNTPTQSLGKAKYRALKKALVRWMYPKARAVIAVSKGVKKDLSKNYRVLASKCKVIYNPIDIDKIRQKSKEEIEHPWFKESIPIITACGRLTLQKNYPLLLSSFARVLKEKEARL